MYVALVALGPSSMQYVVAAEAAGGRRCAWDEVWTCNSYGSVLDSDLIFCMDDVRVQELRTDNLKIQNMLKWLRNHPMPPLGTKIFTSFAHKDYPALQEFPLEEVVNSCGTPYFNNSGAYMIGYAMHRKATRIDLFGFDFTYKDKLKAEEGRACCEFWLGRAMERGIDVVAAPGSNILDASKGRPLYGYDTVEVHIRYKGGKAEIKFKPKKLPTQKEIEALYDHGGP